MIEWWTSLGTVMKILWGITIASSLVFVIQSILTFIGADADGAMDSLDTNFDDPSAVDVSGGSNLYTFRNLVNFLLGFGWTSVLLYDKIASKGILIVVAAIVGIALVAMVMWLFKWLSSMQQSGNINVFEAAKGCQGKAYLPIPAGRSGSGKVQITINNAVREFDAVTDGEEIPTGVQIEVLEVIDASTLLVAKKQ